MALSYSSLDELYGTTQSNDATNLSLLNLEQEAVCKLRQPKPKAKKGKALGKYSEYEGSDINNRNKVITTKDVPMTDIHKATLNCKEKAREQQDIEGFNIGSTGISEYSNFGGDMNMPDDFDLKKYILNDEEMRKTQSIIDITETDMLKTQNSGVNSEFMPNSFKKTKKKNNNKNNNNNNDEPEDIDETVMDKYMNLLLYVLSGILLILVMEQILQLGIKMKM